MVELHEISEEASSSSSTHCRGYDVFLSFRGVDTRHSFTNHLYNALMHANITTFLDDEEIETGEDLKPELETAIKASRASVIVLSTNYATSTWCLDELVLILEQRKASKHIVFPIFYHVEPTHVRKQESSFGDAMTKHRQKMEAETNSSKRCQWAQKIERWNRALTEVADLKGMDANGRLEVELIDGIVKDIFRRLHTSSRFPLPQLIGVENSIKFVGSWLKDTSSQKTHILTILGMGGIGKTSLAKYVYTLHSHEFDTSSFIEDINRRCDEKYNGMLDVQKKLYEDISKPTSVQVHDVSTYTSMIENAVARNKVFLVLDDIGSLDQLDALLGRKGFHPGSKIIITTKDAWLTESCELFKLKGKSLTHEKHFLKGLFEIESQKLFCFHAFMCNDPKAGYEEVSKKLVKYCEGHPMALKVLGRNLHNRDVTYWDGYIDRLKKENDSPINNVLRMSFDSLPSENDKELFKHIACIFVGMDRDVATTILEACDIETRTGITNLIDRCFLSIGWYNELILHQLVQEMGRFVVREESFHKPWERSRLWGHDSFRVLKQKKGTENVLGLTLDMKIIEKEKLHGSLELKTDALSKMDNLMLLQLNYVQINGTYKNFPEELRWLCMHGFPLKSIPSDLWMENLVVLDMSYSNIESFSICYNNPQRCESMQMLMGSYSKGKSLLGSLKILNLSFCEQLRSLGGFDHFPKLEMLILEGCIGLLEVCESIEQCVKLVLVDLSSCSKLQKLRRIIGKLKKVETLLLNGCYLGESRIKSRDMDSLEMIKGLVKIQPMVGVEEKVLRSLGWSKIDFPKEKLMGSPSYPRPRKESEIQMYYEFGIFSTFYSGEEIPNWITDRNKGPSISFTIPSSPNKLRGLNFCCVVASLFLNERQLGNSEFLLDLRMYIFHHLPVIIIRNITKNLIWIYHHYLEILHLSRSGLMLLSHWMFGMNEMECGDQVTITLRKDPYERMSQSDPVIKECGVSFVYDDGEKEEEEEEEDVLGYYKSWNHIIGGDLTGFQSTTGEYILNKKRILLSLFDIDRLGYGHLCGESARFKDKLKFRALSQRKSSNTGGDTQG